MDGRMPQVREEGSMIHGDAVRVQSAGFLVADAPGRCKGVPASGHALHGPVVAAETGASDMDNPGGGLDQGGRPAGDVHRGRGGDKGVAGPPAALTLAAGEGRG